MYETVHGADQGHTKTHTIVGGFEHPQAGQNLIMNAVNNCTIMLSSKNTHQVQCKQEVTTYINFYTMTS